MLFLEHLPVVYILSINYFHYRESFCGYKRSTFSGMITRSKTKEHFTEYTRSLGTTHIFMRSTLVDKYLYGNFSQKEIVRFMTLVNRYWTRIYENNGYAVWDIRW